MRWEIRHLNLSEVVKRTLAATLCAGRMGRQGRQLDFIIIIFFAPTRTAELGGPSVLLE